MATAVVDFGFRTLTRREHVTRGLSAAVVVNRQTCIVITVVRGAINARRDAAERLSRRPDVGVKAEEEGALNHVPDPGA